ncbi:MAG: DegT/DnrJ/EryC1/StrS family aminotransferase [Candidatus Omnitrophica bacterium]|nr:DegT/DnrJ/EryC1/StrS family aminotransferase [Candidatus Omnitrophota bacterium]
MLKRIPIIGASASIKELLCAFNFIRSVDILAEFESAFLCFAGMRYVYIFDSGTSSFYFILRSLKEISARQEVILPAYTAGSLVVAVLKAGLKPVLCDVSLEDFNASIASVLDSVSEKTLAIVCVHSFGIGMRHIQELKSMVPPEVFIIEDCAQSLGTRIGGRITGSFGDAAFFSFKRGKNMPICGGGCVLTNNPEIAVLIEKNISLLSSNKFLCDILAPLKALAFSIGTNPYVYGLCFGLSSSFRETTPPKKIIPRRIEDFYIRLGLILMRRQEDIFVKRHENGVFLLESLNNVEGVILPKVDKQVYPVFNRFPLLFKEVKRLEKTQVLLWKSGFESSRMYGRPLYDMFDLGCNGREFPNARYLAEHLLTLPVHPAVERQALLRLAAVIKER